MRTGGFRALAALAVLSATFFACASQPEHIAPVTEVKAIDFTSYTRRGFLFTTEMYPGRYESMGVITVTRYAECSREEGVTTAFVYRCQQLHISDLLDSLYAHATAMNADAVVKLTARAVDRLVAPSVDVPGLEVSGFAIRRLDKQ